MGSTSIHEATKPIPLVRPSAFSAAVIPEANPRP
jgi:hypothetical protein